MRIVFLLLLLTASAWAGPAKDLEIYLTRMSRSVHFQDDFEQQTGLYTKEALERARNRQSDLFANTMIGYRSFKVGKESISGDRAIIPVKFHIRQDLYYTSRFQMRKTESSWVIEDIHYEQGGSLLKPKE